MEKTSNLCPNRRSQNVKSCKDTAIGNIIQKGAISCLAENGIACKATASFEVKVWNTFGKTLTYLWVVKLGSGASSITPTPHVMIDGSPTEESLEVWIQSAYNVPIDVTCTVTDDSVPPQVDTMTIQITSENEHANTP